MCQEVTLPPVACWCAASMLRSDVKKLKQEQIKAKKTLHRLKTGDPCWCGRGLSDSQFGARAHPGPLAAAGLAPNLSPFLSPPASLPHRSPLAALPRNQRQRVVLARDWRHKEEKSYLKGGRSPYPVGCGCLPCPCGWTLAEPCWPHARLFSPGSPCSPCFLMAPPSPAASSSPQSPRRSEKEERDKKKNQVNNVDTQSSIILTLNTKPTKDELLARLNQKIRFAFTCAELQDWNNWQSVLFTMSEVHSRRKFMALLTSSLQSWRATMHSSWFLPVTSISCGEEQTECELP